MPFETVRLTTRRMDPAEAEIRIDGADGITGRLLGPRCHYASTVEVAYYVKPAPGGGVRAIVPEPSFWDPETPFLYEAVLQAEDGTTTSRRHGLRTVQLSAAGLRVNRKPFRVDGVVRRDLTGAAELRAAGINTILCPVSAANADVWDRAAVLGFFVLGLFPSEPEALALARALKDRASCLGWILDEADLIDPESLQTRLGQEPLIGLRTTSTSIETPSWVQFLAGPASLAAGRLPWLFLNEGGDDAAAPLGMIRL